MRTGIERPKGSTWRSVVYVLALAGCGVGESGPGDDDDDSAGADANSPAVDASGATDAAAGSPDASISSACGGDALIDGVAISSDMAALQARFEENRNLARMVLVIEPG